MHLKAELIAELSPGFKRQSPDPDTGVSTCFSCRYRNDNTNGDVEATRENRTNGICRGEELLGLLKKLLTTLSFAVVRQDKPPVSETVLVDSSLYFRPERLLLPKNVNNTRSERLLSPPPLVTTVVSLVRVRKSAVAANTSERHRARHSPLVAVHRDFGRLPPHDSAPGPRQANNEFVRWPARCGYKKKKKKPENLQ